MHARSAAYAGTVWPRHVSTPPMQAAASLGNRAKQVVSWVSVASSKTPMTFRKSSAVIGEAAHASAVVPGPATVGHAVQIARTAAVNAALGAPAGG